MSEVDVNRNSKTMNELNRPMVKLKGWSQDGQDFYSEGTDPLITMTVHMPVNSVEDAIRARNIFVKLVPSAKEGN